MRYSSKFAVLAAAVSVLAAAEPLKLHPANPHYFLFRERPAVLVTSGEHYGAVLNLDFDYRKYLDTLASDGLNLTRIFSGLYREVPGSFNITRNTLAPADESRFATPFRKVGPLRYDLESWNDEYFRRLRDFVGEAGKRGVVVEMTLFTVYYSDTHWKVSPLNAANNTQGIGRVPYNRVLTLDEAALVAVQERFVRKVVSELNGFDNVYFEVCNEPYVNKEASDEWQRRITDVIVDTESKLPSRHLISWNIANHQAEVKDPHPAVSIFNFHYARPPRAVEMNYGLNRVIGMNETGFDGTMDAVYRIQGWDFLLAGGALYNNLDYSFATGLEDGTFGVPGTDPGWGSPRLRKQLGRLLGFLRAIPFAEMKPAPMENVRLLAGAGVWAGYLNQGKLLAGYRPSFVVGTRRQKTTFELSLPEGKYAVEWWDPVQGSEAAPAAFTHAGGKRTFETPEYTEDLAFIVRAQ